MSRRTCLSLVCVWLTAGVAVRLTAQAVVPPEALSSQLPRLDRPPTYEGPALSMAGAIDAAMLDNPSLVALRREYEAQRYRPAQEMFLPPPSFEAQIWQWPINTVDPRNTNMYMLGVQQELPGRGKRSLRASVADRETQLRENEIAIRAREVVADVKRAYVGLLVARREAELYPETAQVLRQVGDAAQTQYAVGRAPQQDAIKAALELSRLYDDALGARQRVDLAAGQLNALIGRPPTSPIGALDTMADQAAIPALDALQELAVAHQPELQAARLSIERAQAERSVAESERKPDFMLQGGYMLAPRGIDAWFGQVSMSWPSAPWSRGRLDARVAETRADVSAAEARLVEATNILRLAVQQAYVRFKTAEQRVSLLATTILPQSRQALESSRVAYEANRVQLLAVLENQRAIIDAQLAQARALGELAEARADLDRAVGVDVGIR